MQQLSERLGHWQLIFEWFLYPFQICWQFWDGIGCVLPADANLWRIKQSYGETGFGASCCVSVHIQIWTKECILCCATSLQQVEREAGDVNGFLPTRNNLFSNATADNDFFLLRVKGRYLCFENPSTKRVPACSFFLAVPRVKQM